MDYDFDLISGKVEAVYYQKDSTDQFTHRYAYDADNRLITAKTSLVGTSEEDFLFEQDAAYEYFLHGPLARTELGERSVQGLDYAYTLQGWIKGLNSSALVPDKDMGKDGTSTSTATQRVARDAYGYTIGYYDGDYAPIGGSGVKFEVNTTGSAFLANSTRLYNGNISHIAQHNKKTGDAWGQLYLYDQLHRLKRMTSWDNVDLGTYSWGAGSGQLSTYRIFTLLYDENGNITRNIAYSTSLMDNLTYNYTSGTNRLTHVDDGVSSGTHADDLDDQAANNYLYDDAGNLISDAQSTATMSWTAYGKVREVERTDIDQKTRFGYDAGQNRVAKAVIDVSATDTLYTYYVRDAQGNVMAVYERQEDTLIWREQHLYGSARLGILQPGVRWYPGNMPTPNPYFTDTTTLCEGWKYYEITNHLGNVMATINDRKAQFDTDSDDVADYYEAAVMTATDYFPFGAPMRQYQSTDYRYGFNGKETEHDGEFAATVHYDYGFRVYHPAVGRFLSVDPLAGKYAGWSSYHYVLNNPILFIDPDGREVDDVVYFNSKGEEVNRIVTTERYETYVDLNDDGNYSLAPMPNIITEKTDPKYQKYDYLIAAHTAIFNNTTAENRPTTANGLSLDGDQPGALSPTLVKSVIMQETGAGTFGGFNNQKGLSDIMQANVQTIGDNGEVQTDWGDFKANFGLVKGGSATPEQSIFAGIRILYMKGLSVYPVVYDEKGVPSADSNVFWEGGDLNNWWYAARNYRSRKADWYAKAVFNYWHNSFFSKDSKYYKE